MKIQVTDQGIVILKEFFKEVEEVEICKEDHLIIIIPTTKSDPMVKEGGKEL